MTERSTAAGRWLLLVHQLPARPAYERVKLWRRLQVLGAVAVKKTVYALPATEDALEDFLWTAKQIEAAGGDALVCEARLLQGISDAQLRALFDATRDADYRAVAAQATALRKRLSTRRRASTATLAEARATAARLGKRLGEIAALDFFGADAREVAEVALRELEDRLVQSAEPKSGAPAPKPVARALKDLRGKLWVTRRHVHVDRIACAWLIRKFIDPRARFRFVDADHRGARRNELRFDMADAEFTHRGDRCSFEVLLAEAGLRDPALGAIGEIVHDLDLKDGKFGRPETEGIRQLMAGITLASDDDRARCARAAALFDDLYRSLRQKPPGAPRRG